MKHFFTFLILLTCSLAYTQALSKKYDYFVQFNGSQLSKKISVADVLNHSVLKKYKNDSFDIQQFADLFKLDQKITVHGNFSDSIPYYQVTIPIKNRDEIKAFLLKMNDKKAKKEPATKAIVEDFGLFSVFNSGDKRMTVAWNDSHLIIFGLTKNYAYNDYKPFVEEDTIETGSYPVEIIVDGKVDETIDESVLDTPYTDNYYANYQEEKTALDSIQNIQQNELIKLLFENGLTVPSSDKINNNADISSWVNYESVMSNLHSLYSYPMAMFGGYDKFLPMQKEFGNFIKGINVDFYFENNNARIEEIIEYSEQIAEVVNKMTNRKINKNVFDYFPKEKPLAYMSYHLNTKATLENFPSLTADIFQNPKLVKEDIAVFTDLISTIVDEKATASLFDGDLSAFLYDFKEMEVMTKSYDYDENYEEIITDKMVKKSIPLFSLIFTSTHPTFADKLIQLGIRKKGLVQKDNYYIITGTKEYGDVFIKKDKDVVIVSNALNYLNPENGTFSKEAKKDLKKNYMFGKLNITELVNAFRKTETKTSDVQKLNRVSEQFSDITMESHKKLINNKLVFAFKLNAIKSDKNIILQILDLADELTAK
ncbi:hypothetical protein [Flavobacterium piscis]|uniref:DUF4836 family protein n=1 Tax=Flavobacterium piscis TaxID=1114874 RepID=A0ABU1YAM9_9FLAO|nr:hypothetical protein [Flavobacterium piscis]MDR7211296.1 hypothetical protein [Flavobacterium piscis]